MKRSLLTLFACLGLAACGSHVNAQNKGVQQATSKVDQAINRCVKNPLVLRSRAGRVKAARCAFPPKNRQAGMDCLVKVVTSGVPTKARLKAGADTCFLKWA